MMDQGAQRRRTEELPLTTMEKAGFGVGALGVSLAYAAMAVMLLYFYVRVLRIPPATAGTILFLASLADALMDPLVGWLAARTRSRWGKYRPYLLFGALPLSLAFIGVFMMPPGLGSTTIIGALATFIVFRGAFQLIFMPYTSMIAVLTRDPDERSVLESWRGWFIAAGSLAISLFGLSLVRVLGDGDDQAGFRLAAVVIAVLMGAFFLFCGLATRERYTGDDLSPDVSNPIKVTKLLAQNRPFLAVVFGTMSAQAAYALLMSTSVVFFEIYFKDRELSRWPLAASTAAGLIVSPFWGWLSQAKSKRFAWVSGLALASAALLALNFLHGATLWPYVAAFFLVGSGIQSAIIVQYAAAADALDYGEWKTGERSEAVGFALMTFTMKVSLAIGNGAAAWLLAGAGFHVGVSDPHTIELVRMILTIAPAIGFGLAALIVSGFKLNSDQHRAIIRELNARRTSAAVALPGRVSIGASEAR